MRRKSQRKICSKKDNDELAQLKIQKEWSLKTYYKGKQKSLSKEYSLKQFPNEELSIQQLPDSMSVNNAYGLKNLAIQRKNFVREK